MRACFVPRKLIDRFSYLALCFSFGCVVVLYTRPSAAQLFLLAGLVFFHLGSLLLAHPSLPQESVPTDRRQLDDGCIAQSSWSTLLLRFVYVTRDNSQKRHALAP